MTVIDNAVYLSSTLQGVKLDAQSGVVLWRHSGPGSGGGSSVAALFNGRIYMDHRNPGKSVVLNADSGALVSTFDSVLAPAFDASHAYQTSFEWVRAVRHDSNQVDWTYPLPTAAASPPLAAPGVLLLHLVTGEVQALDAASGRLWWRSPNPAPVGSTGGTTLTTGMALGRGILVVPVTNRLVVYRWPGG